MKTAADSAGAAGDLIISNALSEEHEVGQALEEDLAKQYAMVKEADETMQREKNAILQKAESKRQVVEEADALEAAEEGGKRDRLAAISAFTTEASNKQVMADAKDQIVKELEKFK